MSCQELALHTEVPVKGDPGDSNGYLCFNPEPDTPHLVRLRFPFAFALTTVSRDGISPTGARYRQAGAGAMLAQYEWEVLPLALEVPADTTLELELNTPETGAVLTLQLVKLLPTA
jgi:hypothetical protein